MKKAKYIVSALLVAVVTLSFLIFPSAFTDYRNSKSEEGKISDIKLAQSNQKISCGEIFDIISIAGESPNLITVDNEKSQKEYISDCGKIITAAFKDNRDFRASAEAYIGKAKKIKAVTLKLVTIYDEEVRWVNFIICTFDGLSVCYEDENLLPIYITFSKDKVNNDISQYIDKEGFFRLIESLSGYYSSVGVDMYDLNEGSFYYETVTEINGFFLGYDIAESFYNFIRVKIFDENNDMRNLTDEIE